MTSTEMQEAVAQLPDEYLRNYTESYEAGIVGDVHDCCFCAVGCMANPASEARRTVRGEGYAEINLEPAPDAIETMYFEATFKVPFSEREASTAAFRTALYDACIREQAARAAKSHRLPTECPETLEAQT